MYCKHCGSELSDNSRFCPNCGASTNDSPTITPLETEGQQEINYEQVNYPASGKTKVKKPIYKKWWFWVIVVLLLGSIGNAKAAKTTTANVEKTTEVSSTKSSDNSNSTTEADATPNPTAAAKAAASTPRPTATPKPTPEPTATPQPTEFHVGDTLETPDLKIVYVSSGDYYEDNMFLQPDDGYKYICIELYCENIADHDVSVSEFSFSCYADGYACDQYYGVNNGLSATLSAGRTTTGKIAFSVPVNAEVIEIEYDYSSLFSSKKATFLYEGNWYADVDTQKEVSATEGAYNVGDVVDTGALKITYVSCGEYHSDNYFIQPDSGKRFIYCKFEVENTSDSDQLISTFSFDCYADGVNCDANYVSDESLDATLSPGRKTAGIVSFEIPYDAQVVEVEYLDNYWTSSRIVFVYHDYY